MSAAGPTREQYAERMDKWRRKVERDGVPAGSFKPPPDDAADCRPMNPEDVT